MPVIPDPAEERAHFVSLLWLHWSDYYAVWADEQGYHAEALMDATRVHTDTYRRMCDELAEDFRARRAQHVEASCRRISAQVPPPEPGTVPPPRAIPAAG